MTFERVQIPPIVEEKLAALASASGVSIEEFVADAICTKVTQAEAWQRLRKGLPKVTREEFLDALAAAPHAPPQPGDELPEGWTPIKP